MVDQVSDQAVLEVLQQNGQIRILVEMKGQSTFPYCFHSSRHFESVFCQLIQQAALALIADMWNITILLGQATKDMWFLFFLVDSENVCSNVQFNIIKCFYQTVQAPQKAPFQKGKVRSFDQFGKH